MARNRMAEGGSPTVDHDQNSGTKPDSNSSGPSRAVKFRQNMSRLWHRLWIWPWLIPLCAAGLTGVSAFMWLASLPPLPSCKKLSATTLSDSERLYCADQGARGGDIESLSSALELASTWKKGHPLYAQANRLADEWSKSILVIARQKVDRGDLKQAVALAQKVPKPSGTYSEAQSLIKLWQQNWDQGEKFLKKAESAIKVQNWPQATEQVRLLVQLGNEYWQKRADTLVADMAVERQAFTKLQKAQDLADYGGPEDLAEAIQKASQIDSKRLAFGKVKQSIEKWSQKLLDLAEYHWEVGNYETAMAAAEKIPPSSKLSDKAIALVQLSKAETIAEDDQAWSYLQAWVLTHYGLPRNSLPETGIDQVLSWERQIQNLGQIQLAKFFANFDQIFTLNLAIDHAGLVQQDQPRRVEAQTFIAQWQKQIATFSDRQYLTRARQFAGENTSAGFKAAIAEASKIGLGQPLRVEAQTSIEEWANAVERIEDQPLLDQAYALAKSGNLNAAIQMAEKIPAGRALYGEAQDAVLDWVSQIQITQDRPILNDAEALARRGSLTAAISRASEIGYGRVLYYEAQDWIAQWVAERAEIEAARQPQVDEPEDVYDQPIYNQPQDYNEPVYNDEPEDTQETFDDESEADF